MTVNERLFIGGFLHEFDKAVEEKNIEKIISILKAVELPASAIDPPGVILTRALLSPVQ